MLLKSHSVSLKPVNGRRSRSVVTRAAESSRVVESDWRSKAKPIQPGSSYPAKEFCSNCGLCDTYYIAHVKDACSFLGPGESMLCLHHGS